MSDKDTPVITIDGPTASGKGTVSQLLASHLGFHYLDSGALYRLTALAVQRRKMDENDRENIAWVARLLNCRFSGSDIFLDEENVSHHIRQESIGNLASRIAAFPAVREALTELQQSFRKPPGLVADGRDMGTCIFPDAFLKVYMTASVDARADRRYKQLMEKGFSANISDLRRDIAERDQRDMQRDAAPLRPAEDAFLLDSTDMSIAATVECILSWYEQKRSGIMIQPT